MANLEQESENYVWTAVDKSVINEIVDSLLLDPSLKKSYDVTHDVTARKTVNVSTIDAPGGVKPCHALSAAVLGGNRSRIKTEDQGVTPRNSGSRGDDVADADDDVKLVDVTRRFDVTEMGFKWKSKLLWRMNRDRASRAYASKLCMT